MRRAFLPLCLLACVLGTAPAAAQPWYGPEGEPSSAELAEARELYQAGTQQVEQNRWSDALESFERSYALSGASVALYSLAYTLRVVGRYRSARDAFTQLLREHHDLEPEIRREAELLRREVMARVAVLRLAGLPVEPTPTVLLDGSSVADDGTRPLAVDADPGEHALRVEAPGHEPFTWRGSVAPGGEVTVDVALEPEGGGVGGAVLWIGLGAAVVVAAVVVGIILYGNAQLGQRTEHGVTL